MDEVAYFGLGGIVTNANASITLYKEGYGKGVLGRAPGDLPKSFTMLSELNDGASKRSREETSEDQKLKKARTRRFHVPRGPDSSSMLSILSSDSSMSLPATLQAQARLSSRFLRLQNEEMQYLSSKGRVSLNESSALKPSITPSESKFPVGLPVRSILFDLHKKKGWTIKPGIKVGADYAVYSGPAFRTHARYSVLLSGPPALCSSEGEQTVGQSRLDWIGLMGTARVAEGVAKELVLCDLEEEKEEKDVLNASSVVLKRWIPHSLSETRAKKRKETK